LLTMTDDPWKVLELDGPAATLAEVKRSYARLLKETRPDRDPEGFMRLRAAYEVAQAILRGDASQSVMPVGQAQASDAGESSPSAPRITALVRDIPAEVDDVVKQMRAAILTRVRQKIRLAWAAYEEAVGKHALSRESRWLIFSDVFQGNDQLLADTCTDEPLIEHLKHGEMRLLRLVTDVWSKTGDSKRLDEFCVSLNRQRELANSETGAMALAVTAIALAAWNPEQAARFAQRAFPKLPTSQRSELAERIDYETLLGRLVGPLPQSFKIPWIEALRLGDSERPWKEMITRDMVIAVIRHCGLQWPGLPVLYQRLKPDAWAELKALAESLLR
jgi:hypothetical protein